MFFLNPCRNYATFFICRVICVRRLLEAGFQVSPRPVSSKSMASLKLPRALKIVKYIFFWRCGPNIDNLLFLCNAYIYLLCDDLLLSWSLSYLWKQCRKWLRWNSDKPYQTSRTRIMDFLARNSLKIKFHNKVTLEVLLKYHIYPLQTTECDMASDQNCA